jgi:hypothetical protein
MPATGQLLSGIQQDPMKLPDPGETHRSIRDQVEASQHRDHVSGNLNSHGIHGRTRKNSQRHQKSLLFRHPGAGRDPETPVYITLDSGSALRSSRNDESIKVSFRVLPWIPWPLNRPVEKVRPDSREATAGMPDLPLFGLPQAIDW